MVFSTQYYKVFEKTCSMAPKLPLPFEPPDYEIHVEGSSTISLVHRDVLSNCSSYFKPIVDAQKFEEGHLGKATLTHNGATIERLLRFIYGKDVDWLTIDEDDLSSDTAVKDKFEKLMSLREIMDYYDVADLRSPTHDAFKRLFEGTTQLETLTWMGAQAYDSEHVARYDVLWEVQNQTRKLMREIVRDPEAWKNLYECEEYMKAVTCLLSGCYDCRRAKPH